MLYAFANASALEGKARALWSIGLDRLISSFCMTYKHESMALPFNPEPLLAGEEFGQKDRVPEQ